MGDEKRPRVSVVIPCYNEVENIEDVLNRIKGIVDAKATEILVVDDGSTDGTSEILDKAGVRVVRHPYNKGNGASVKSGIRNALGEVIVLMDGDGQHRPEDIPRLLEELEGYDMVVAERNKESIDQAGRQGYRKIVNLFASYITGMRIPDLLSGFRAIRRDLAMKFVYLLPNSFSYPSTLTLSLIKAGYSVKFVSLRFEARKGSSKISPFRDGMKFFMIIIKVATLFDPMKIFLPASAVSFIAGLLNYIRTYISYGKFTNMSMLLILMGFLIFLMGLIAEQISQLRMDRAEQ